MSGDYWDPTRTGIGPNLTRLPPEVRQNLTKPIPMREGESYGRVVLFTKTQGLVHPNGRVNVTTHIADPTDPEATASGVQIDASDFTARIPLATFVLAKAAVPGVLTNLLRSFIALGATEEEIAACLEAAKQAPKISMAAVVNYEEQRSND